MHLEDDQLKQKINEAKTFVKTLNNLDKLINNLDKLIVTLLLTSFINGVVNVNAFCFVFKLLIVAYVEDAVDDNNNLINQSLYYYLHL